ncbi:MAG: DUF1674 domain-containing protein [Parasphingorhabdus sp.]|nr:DUF1674 domain-containing protein [Parasphingorhabdus sp.]
MSNSRAPGVRPPNLKPPAHLTPSPPVPEPSKSVKKAPKSEDLDPVRYGDWEKNGIAIDF